MVVTDVMDVAAAMVIWGSGTEVDGEFFEGRGCGGYKGGEDGVTRVHYIEFFDLVSFKSTPWLLDNFLAILGRWFSYAANLEAVFSVATREYASVLERFGKAIFKPPKAIRGGISICFPHFGDYGSPEQHGFARNKIWTIDDDPPPLPLNDSQGKSFVDLLLEPSEEDLKFWPHSFEFRLRVCLGSDGNLTLISRVRNMNGKPFSFSFAYHSYLFVSDISEVRIEGLETMDYLDNLCNRERFTEQGDAITFESELGSRNCVAILDHERKQTYVLKAD